MTEQVTQILDQNTKIGPNPCIFDLEYQFDHENWHTILACYENTSIYCMTSLQLLFTILFLKQYQK